MYQKMPPTRKYKVYCSIQSCENNKGSDSYDVHFFKPKKYTNHEAAGKWLELLKQHQNCNSSKTLCHLHFDEKYLIRQNNTVKLKDDAIPTIFLSPEPSKSDEKIHSTSNMQPIPMDAEFSEQLSTIDTNRITNQIKESINENEDQDMTEPNSHMDVMSNDMMDRPLCSGCDERDFKIRMLVTEIDSLKTKLEKLVQYVNSSSLDKERVQDILFPAVQSHELVSKIETEPTQMMTIDEIITKNIKQECTNQSQADPLLIHNADDALEKPSNSIPNSFIAETDSEKEHMSMETLPDGENIPLSQTIKLFKCGKCGECFEHGKELSQHLDKHELHIISPRTEVERIIKIVPMTDIVTITKITANTEIAPKTKTSAMIKSQSKPIIIDQHMATKYCVCNICGQKVEVVEINRHFCGAEKQVNCAYCSEILTSTRQLVEHLKNHVENITMFRCSKCSKLFSMKILVEYHQQSHKNPEKKKTSTEVSAKHTNTDHSGTAIKGHLCEQCGSTLSSKRSYLYHMQSHKDPTILMTVKCPKCPRVFKNEMLLKKHSNIHRNIKYTCGICETETSSSPSLTAHMKLHHSSNNVQRVECKICFKKLKRCNYNDHMKLHTDSIRHKCDHCTQTYKHRGDLIKHLRTHLGDKIYKCDQCDERFKFQVELKKHSFEHYKEQ